MLRRMLFGVMTAVAVCGVATAKPPGGPLSEGRESDPVAREFYHGEPPTPPVGSADPSRTAPKPSDTRVWPVLATLSVLEGILSGVEMPLGPFSMNGM